MKTGTTVLPAALPHFCPGCVRRSMATGLQRLECAFQRLQFLARLGEHFLGSDGTLSKDIMPDLLHPNGKGYEIWADAIRDKVTELMK